MKKVLSIILVAGIIFLIALFAALSRLGLINIFRGGTGSGNGTDADSSVSESIPTQSVPADENKVSEIRIEGNKIFFDDDPCETVDELKQQIINIGTEREYTFVHDNALKGTYDEVWAVLSDLEDALGITINDK